MIGMGFWETLAAAGGWMLLTVGLAILVGKVLAYGDREDERPGYITDHLRDR